MQTVPRLHNKFFLVYFPWVAFLHPCCPSLQLAVVPAAACFICFFLLVYPPSLRWTTTATTTAKRNINNMSALDRPRRKRGGDIHHPRPNPVFWQKISCCLFLRFYKEQKIMSIFGPHINPSPPLDPSIARTHKQWTKKLPRIPANAYMHPGRSDLENMTRKHVPISSHSRITYVLIRSRGARSASSCGYSHVNPVWTLQEDVL